MLPNSNKDLRVNSMKMYTVFGPLEQEFVPNGDYSRFCFRHGKRWSPVEKSILKHHIKNIWDMNVIREICKILGRTPYSVFNVFIEMTYSK